MAVHARGLNGTSMTALYRVPSSWDAHEEKEVMAGGKGGIRGNHRRTDFIARGIYLRSGENLKKTAANASN
jgi:hypothetical protein